MEFIELTDPKHWLESDRLLATAFMHPWDEAEESRKVEQQAAGKLPRPERSWGIIGDDGRMATTISTLRHTLSFGGEPLQVGEVHMVGTLPEARGTGGVSALMRFSLDEFWRRKDALAVLIPFSCSFYRKYGFEMVGRMLRQRVPIDQLAGFGCDLVAERIWDEEQLEPVKQLWHDYAPSRDLSDLRDDPGAWAWRGNGEFGEPDFMHPERQRYAYTLWDDDPHAGAYQQSTEVRELFGMMIDPEDFSQLWPQTPTLQPRAYVLFSFFHEPDLPFVGELQVDDLAYDSPEALRAVLGFLYRMRAKVSHVNFELADVDLATLVPECDKVEQNVDSHVMARMLDVRTLLMRMPHPQDRGSYTIGVTDEYLPYVSGAWRVEYEDGHATSVLPYDYVADLEVDQTVGCQLILGRIALAEALGRPGFELNGNEYTLSKVFVRRPIHLAL